MPKIASSLQNLEERDMEGSSHRVFRESVALVIPWF